jgi:hypothetical protein
MMSASGLGLADRQQRDACRIAPARVRCGRDPVPNCLQVV